MFLLAVWHDNSRASTLRGLAAVAWRAVFTRSPAFIGTSVGAITSHLTPSSANCQ